MPQRDTRGLFLPELMEPEPGAWTINEVDIQEAAVDTQQREAWVPKAHTPAQRLARLHEGGHVKYSPRDWMQRITAAKVNAESRLHGKKVDFNAVEKIQKMLEENRIDWILWDRHGIDLRPAREVLDWARMPDPPSVLYSLGMALQLAWTVWASRGLGSKSSIPHPPPARTVDRDTGEYFDRCWAFLCEQNEPLARAMIRGCMRMYANPTHEMRDQVAGELATFFPVEEEEEQTAPPPKKEEQQAQDEAEKEEQAQEQYKDECETGIGSEVKEDGRVQYHDHTTSVRRPSMRIARRAIPVSQGLGLKFPHRYFLDKAIFSQRLLTEAGIMVDGSGSMSWNDQDMQALVARLPAVTVGIYSGLRVGHYNAAGQQFVGRICIIAKGGRFARFNRLDPECDEGNDVDVEALRLLATWPKPRLWLSDGFVCGGLHSGPPIYHPQHGFYTRSDGRIHELCNAIMQAHEIYRVPNREVMHKLLKRERVTLYRSTTASKEEMRQHGLGYMKVQDVYPVDPMPITFQL